MEETLRLTVSELTQLVKETLETSFYGLTVEGEISRFTVASTGHWYFTLKDSQSVISATMWRNVAMKTGFIPKDGQKVTVTGSISVYPPRGTYSINCTSMRPAGEGDILAMLEERKRRYAALGWFDQSLKKPIPLRPDKVAVITSSTGAALQDILQVTGRRNAGMDIIILPAQVQGPGAAREIAGRIRQVNMFLLAPVMIVGRGGGSVEDLLPFSDDLVIQAIHESQVPVISAVGHEIDWAISDFVSDLRAPTPSAAAELVSGSESEQMEKLASVRLSMLEGVNSRLGNLRLRLAGAGTQSCARIVSNRIGNTHIWLDSVIRDLKNAAGVSCSGARRCLEAQTGLLKAVNPVSVLERGFAIVSTEDGRTVRHLSDVEKESRLSIRLLEGRIGVYVTEVEE